MTSVRKSIGFYFKIKNINKYKIEIITKKKKNLLNGLIPGTEEYVLKHAEWRRSRGKKNPSECLRNIYNGKKNEFLDGDSYAIRKHNEFMLYQPRKKMFVTISNPNRSLLIAQRHKKQFDLNLEKADDLMFEDSIIRSVSSSNANSYYITSPDGWSIFVETINIIPKPGDVIRYYGNGIGAIVRGVDIEGVEISYESQRQLKQRFKKELMKSEREDKNHFKKIESNLDERFSLLPTIFQQRIERFRKNNLNFRWKYEESEISLIEESIRIAKAMHSHVLLFNKVEMHDVHKQFEYVYTEELNRIYEKFYDYSDEKMLDYIPNFGGGHFGNSHGFVFRIAFVYLTKPENIPFIHGWLAPMKGCFEYGCHTKKSKKQKKNMVIYDEVV